MTSADAPLPQYGRHVRWVETGCSRTVFGVGSIAWLTEELDRLGAARAVLIVAGSVEPPTGVPVVDSVTDPLPHAPETLVEQLRNRAMSCRADALLAIGGGSVIGLAKAVALVVDVPIIAVPTTYSGSEMTPMWSIRHGGGRSVGMDPRVTPRIVIYDPRLQRSLRATTSAASGLNALANAVEALWAPAANPVSTAVAEDAVRALARGLERILDVPDDLVVRTTMLRGAWLAGMAMAGAGVAIHHQLCDLLVGEFDLPHAEVHAAVLPHVTATLAPGVPGAMARIARALGVADPVGELHRLVAQLGLPSGMKQLGLTEGQVRNATEVALGAALTSPRPLSREGVRGLVRRIFDGSEEASGPRPRACMSQHL